jgi:hypothetical protein
MHYRLSETLPSTVSTSDGRAITTRQTVSLITVGVRDSSGVSLWELRVDSTSSVIIPRDSLGAQNLSMQLGPVTLRRPKSYRASVRNGRVLATITDGQPADFPFSAGNPQWSLLVQLPALASLPKAGLPDRVGESRVDTTAHRTPLPGGAVDDTTIVQWTRTAVGLVNGAMTHKRSISASPSRTTNGIGSVQIVLDTKADVLEVRSKLEERTRLDRNAAMEPSDNVLVTTTTLVQVP